MNTQNKSQIDKFALILLFLFCASTIYTTTNHFLSFMIGEYRYDQLVQQSRFTNMVYSVFQFIVYIGSSIWLYKEAKANNNKPWLWALLGLFGGLIAVVLWYLKSIYSLLSARETE